MDDPIMLGIIAVAVLAVLGIVFLKGKEEIIVLLGIEYRLDR